VLPNLTKAMNEDWTGPAVKLLTLDQTAENPEEIADAARDFYFGEKNISRENVGDLINLFTGIVL